MCQSCKSQRWWEGKGWDGREWGKKGQPGRREGRLYSNKLAVPPPANDPATRSRWEVRADDDDADSMPALNYSVGFEDRVACLPLRAPTAEVSR